MGVRSRSKRKRRRRASAGGADLISGLGDDVLVRILELLPDAGDAVRTGALSRRWRGLWTRVGSLSFDSSSRRRGLKRASSDERFLAFVQNALAQRAKTDAALDLERLAISFAIMSPDGDQATFAVMSPADKQAIKLLALRSADTAHELICYAMERKVKSFVLKLRLFSTRESIPVVRSGWAAKNKVLMKMYRLEQPTINLKDLPSSEKLETMHWDLEKVWLQLPDAAVFASLVDLTLENIHPDGVGSDHLLARLLSSACCPSLQKLQLRNLMLLSLNIEASALLELTIMSSPETLKLKTPSLRVFRLENCDHHGNDDGIRVEIWAPKLEELIFLPRQPDHIEVDGELPCVESLKVIDLYTNTDEDDFLDEVNDSSICLLSRCTSLTCLEVSLKVTMGEGSVNNITERIPHLPHLISLTVHVYSRKLHSFGAGLAEILKQCNHLKYLHIHCIHEAGHDNDSFYGHSDLANIQEVEFTGLAGIECESWFMKRVFEHARQLQKVALSFDPRFRLYNMIDDSMFVLCSVGTWICHDAGLSYEWNPGTP